MRSPGTPLRFLTFTYLSGDDCEPMPLFSSGGSWLLIVMRDLLSDVRTYSAIDILALCE